MLDHVRTSSTQQVRGNPYMWIGIHKKLRVDTYRNWRRSNKNGETRKGGRARHWLESTTTVTHSCNGSRTSQSSRTRQKDRNSSSSSSTSCRLAAEQRLQHMQEKFEGVDPRIGWCGVIRVVRNYTKCIMFSMSSFLESRNLVLHLRTVFDWQRIQKKVQQTTTGCTLYPELRDKERTQSWCSTWKNRSTKSIPPGLEESRLSRWTFYRCSRAGRTCERRPFISSHSRGKAKIPSTMVSHLEQIRQEWANETSIRFSSCCLFEKSSTPRVRRTNWRANFTRAIQYMASLFKHIVAEQELQMSS